MAKDEESFVDKARGFPSGGTERNMGSWEAVCAQGWDVTFWREETRGEGG